MSRIAMGWSSINLVFYFFFIASAQLSSASFERVHDLLSNSFKLDQWNLEDENVHKFSFTQSDLHQTGSFEPEFYMDVEGLITSKGYPCESHWVTAEDGFILRMFRIPHGINGKTRSQQDRPVVFLQHGLVEDASSFVNNLANQSLGFVLADAGADVWLGNIRGNVYSQNHTRLKRHQQEFWNWSFDEMARYDVPVMVRYVVQHTGGSKIFYVGHSQGSGIGFIQMSRDPDLAQLIERHFALVPATRVNDTDGLGKTISKIGDVFYFFFYVVQHGPTSYNVPLLPPLLCQWIGYETCRDFLFSLTGGNKASFNTSRLPIYFSNFPQPTSMNTVLHWFQLIKSGEFQNFDEGSPRDNMKRYGQETPPLYDLTTYSVPTSIYYGGHDNFIQETDIKWLCNQTHADQLIYIPQFEHQDFVWGIDAVVHVYGHIVDTIFRR